MKRVFWATKATLLAFTASLLLGSCSEEIISQYLKISDSSITLDAAGLTEFTIDVSSSSDWTASIESSWINEVSRNSAGITLSANAYTGTTARYGSVIIKTSFDTRKVTVQQSNNSLSVFINYEFVEGVSSPSGYYLAGSKYISDTEILPTTIDLRTGEIREYDCELPTEITVVERATTYEVSWKVSEVDDNGNIFMINDVMIWGLRIDATTGQYAMIEVPSDMIGGGVNAVSADGTIWAGFGCPLSGGWVPMKWVNGVPERLPISDTNGTGLQSIWYGSAVRGCSDDGSIIYGSIMDYWEAIYWDKNNEMHFIAPELLEYSIEEYDGEYYCSLTAGARIYSDSQRVSANGKWISFIYNNETTGVSAPGYLDTETGVPTILYDMSGLDIMAISNEGDLFLSTTMLLEPTTVYTAEGETVDGMTWLTRNYGVVIEDNRAITQVTANGDIFGFKSYSDSYIAWWLERD